MDRRWNRALGGAMAWLCAASGAAAGQTAGATFEDVLAMRSFGAASVSPDGRWAVYEREAAYTLAERYDRGVNTAATTTDLLIAAVAGGTPQPLLAETGGWALRLGPWSPDGAHLVVHRWRDEVAETGVVRLSDRSVIWTALTPDLPITGVGATWLNAHRLALTVRPDGDLPWRLRAHDTAAGVMAERWATTAEGRTASRLAVETRNGALLPDLGPATRRLVVIDVRSGRQAAVAEGAIRDVAPSPDGRRAAILTEAEPAPLRPEERAIQNVILRRTRLAVVDLETGRSIDPDVRLDVAPHLLRWSRDSRQVLVWARRDDQAWRDGALAAVDVSGRVERFEVGRLEPTLSERPTDEVTPPRADWLGDRPVLRARPQGSDRFDWWALSRDEPPAALTARSEAPPETLAALDGEAVLYLADGALWRTGADGGTTRVGTAGAGLADGERPHPRVTLRHRFNGAARRNWVVAQSEAGVAALTTEGAALWRVRAPCAGLARVLAAGAAGGLVRCLENGVETLRLGSGEGERVLERLNMDLATRPFATARPIPHQDWRGRPVESYLYLPPGVPPSAVKGVFVHVYPGGAYDGRYVEASSVRAAISPQLLAMGGYAVLSAYLPGLTGEEGEARFDVLAQGVDLAVDALLAAEPGLPGNRLALVGHSFGGYAALGIATRTRRFGAVVAWAAPTDMIGTWGELLSHARLSPRDALSFAQPIGYTETGQARMGSPPWEALDLYAAASPALLAGRITTPVLLITADQDFVSPVQTERMFAALHRLGKPARLVEYWGEGHNNASPANLRDAYAEIFEWVARAQAESLASQARTQPSNAASVRISP